MALAQAIAETKGKGKGKWQHKQKRSQRRKKIKATKSSDPVSTVRHCSKRHRTDTASKEKETLHDHHTASGVIVLVRVGRIGPVDPNADFSVGSICADAKSTSNYTPDNTI